MTHEDWLKVLYEEAWRQYVHEDNLSLRRNALFLSIQTAFFAIVTAVAGWVIERSDSSGSHLVLLAAVMLMFALLGIVVNFAWQGATERGRAYTWFRHICAHRLEWEAGVGDLGLAQREHLWRREKQHENQEYEPFPDHEFLRARKVPKIGKMGHWDSTFRISSILITLWVIIGIIGLVLLILGGARLFCQCP
ncbi:MAG: hypothetical protein FJY66_03005 [Calditrichaeota bacterium]|nr:hypothetical protein [Calditrichota bacterium]